MICEVVHHLKIYTDTTGHDFEICILLEMTKCLRAYRTDETDKYTVVFGMFVPENVIQ